MHISSKKMHQYLLFVSVSVSFIQLCPSLCDPVNCDPRARQAPVSMEFSRQEYWSGLPFPSARGLPNPGIKHRSPTLQADSLSFELPAKPTGSLAATNTSCTYKVVTTGQT